MRVLDANVVLAAHRGDHPHFEPARPWLDRLLESGEAFAVPDLVAGTFLRLATNHRIFKVPTPLPDAFGYLTSLRGQPGQIVLAPGPRHLELLKQLCSDYGAAGDLVPDAQLAAIAIEHGSEVVSFDRDFARFAGLRWSVPGQA